MEDFDPEPEVAEIVPRMLQGEAGFQSFYDRYRQEIARLTYAPVGMAGWSLAIIYPEDELMAEVNELILRQTALLLLGLAILVAVVWLLSRYLTRPIKALASSAGRIATGDLELELPEVKSRDEIGTLTKSFHHMRDSLKTYIHDLQVTTAAKERLESELQIARKIQMDMLPEGDIGGGPQHAYELSAKLIPARAVGGDLYYHFVSDGRLYFMAGDVSGKGVPAALFMARAVTLFQTVALLESDIGATLAAMNRSLCKENDAGMFVTCFAGVLDGASGELSFAVGGFDPPVSITTKGGKPQFIEFEGGPVLGLLDVPLFETNRRTFFPGETLVLYTDGVSEALNEKEEFFNADRLIDVLADLGPIPASQVSTLVMKAVKDFAGKAPQSDDITVLALRYTSTKAAE
jgi:sigma-B regulation protein RsbU (phosphoserine phosphatase)